MDIILLWHSCQALPAGISVSELFLDDLACDFTLALEARQVG